MTDAQATGSTLRPVLDDTHETTRPCTRPMLISPNLRAALEYDEQARNTTDRSSTPVSSIRSSTDSLRLEESQSGLPPPPRPKSSTGSLRRAKSPPSSPAFMAGLVDNRATPYSPPVTSHSHSFSSVMNSTSLLNPYINPPPRLPHLQAENSAPAFWPERNRPLADHAPRSIVDAPSSDFPRRMSHSPIQTSSPESAGSSDGRPSFQRHLRYWSTLPKVEKLLVIGKTLAVGKQADGRPREGAGRRASDVGLVEADPADKLGRDVQPMMRQYRKVLAKGRSSSGERHMSAPSSPIIYSPDVQVTADSTTRIGEALSEVFGDGDGSIGRLVGAASELAPGSAAARRALISHGRSHSAATSQSNASSESSHEPPSTPHDARISISSTIYQDSHYSIPFDPPFDSPFQPGRPVMHSSDRESFIDLASPTFSPRSPEFSVNTANSAWQSPSYRTDPLNSTTLPKPSPPRIVTAVHKPPLPTSPKPDFTRRSPSAQPPHRRPSPSESPQSQDATASPSLPPTTNFLNPQERAELVRKNRKLAQVFGQTPGAKEALASSQVPPDTGVPAGLLCAPANLMPGLGGKRKHQRAAVSMSVNTSGTGEVSPRAVWPPPEGTKHLTLGARRHSSPFTPDATPLLDDASVAGSDALRRSPAAVEVSSQEVGVSYSDWNGRTGEGRRGGAGLTSPTSFIDLSEEELTGDGSSSITTIETPKSQRRPTSATSPSSASIYSVTSVELAEEERRRKRDKLARLHRFLGSRVPTEAVLAQLRIDTAVDLPPIAPASAIEAPHDMDAEARKVWIRRRRSSSAAELGGKWSDEIDRLKEELNDREKARNVKRALKMERMFGVAPPQTLYHTRAAPSTAGVVTAALVPFPRGSPSSNCTTPPSPRNLNQTAYSRNKIKKNGRPGTADSSEPLMSDTPQSGFKFGFSDVYEHYRHSLNSLSDIIDRDDKESLERLHDLIHGGDGDEPPLKPFLRKEDSPPATPKAERRRSLPSRTSMTSLSSEFSACPVVSPEPEEAEFQTRRRRAAKLTQFFGVNYRDLMSEILESIEKGLEEERGLGTLKPDEVQELLTKLRKLKTKRIG